jgi:LCP family protein required for cell wall assembly
MTIRLHSRKNNKHQQSIDGFVPSGMSTGSRRSLFTDVSAFNTEESQGVANFNTEGFSSGNQVAFDDNQDAPKKRGLARKYSQHSLETVDRVDLSQEEEETQKKRQKHRRYGFKFFLKLSLVCVLLVFVSYGAVGVNAYLKARNIFKGGGESAVLGNKDVDPSKLTQEGDGRINILLTGMRGEGDGAELTDTIVIASIDQISKQATLLGVPRDLWVKNKEGVATKVNQVYADAKYAIQDSYNYSERENDSVVAEARKAGIDALETTLEETLGIPIHYYAMVDFTAFRNVIDTLGGVTIDVKTQVYDTFIMNDNYGNPLIAAVGVQQFDGRRALLYAQSRHGSPRGDFDRNERQREVILAIKDKALSLGTFANPSKLNSLVNSFGGHVFTNLSIDSMLALYDLAKDIDAASIKSVGLADLDADLLTDSTSNEGLYITIPKEGEFEYQAIRTFVHTNMRDSYINKENASVQVFNASGTEGLAQKETDDLRSYGYNLLEPESLSLVSRPENKVLLIDLTDGRQKYTKHYLENRLGTTAIKEMPEGVTNSSNAEFVIILVR